MIKTNLKRLKATLVSEIKKLGLLSLILKLGEFLLFDNFIPDLAYFQDLDNFLPFEFPDLNNFFDFLGFLIGSSSLPNPTTTPLPSFFIEAGMLGDLVVFNIKGRSYYFTETKDKLAI